MVKMSSLAGPEGRQNGGRAAVAQTDANEWTSQPCLDPFVVIERKGAWQRAVSAIIMVWSERQLRSGNERGE